jgi:hypothetical protein
LDFDNPSKEISMAFNPKDAVDAVRDIASNAVEKASDIVEHAGDIVRGDVSGGISGIVENSIDIATHAAGRTMDAVKGRHDDEPEAEDAE